MSQRRPYGVFAASQHNKCMFFLRVGGGGYVKNQAVRAARKSTRTHAILTPHCSHQKRCGRGGNRVDSSCITRLSFRPIKPASLVRNPGVKSAAGSGTRCTRKHFLDSSGCGGAELHIKSGSEIKKKREGCLHNIRTKVANFKSRHAKKPEFAFCFFFFFFVLQRTAACRDKIPGRQR